MRVSELIECLKKFDQKREIIFDCTDSYCEIYEEHIHEDEFYNLIIIGYE